MDSSFKKILIIDDQEEARELIAVSLREGKFEIFSAPSGREGIQIAKLEHPDLILLDMKMPQFDGVSTCKVLKRFPGTKDIPVIFLTASHGAEDVSAALNAGGKDYLVKPFSPNDLLNRVRALTGTVETKFNPASVVKKEDLPALKPAILGKKKKSHAPPQLSFEKNGDVMALSTTFGSLEMADHRMYRDAFNNIISDGISKVAFDIDAAQSIDGTGLALLISVHEVLRDNGGALKITYPVKKLNSRFSFVSLNHLFRSYKNLQEVIDSFEEPESMPEEPPAIDKLNLCLACTFVNPPEFRHCGYCGSNLMISRGDKICRILRRLISRKIFSDAQTDDILEMNRRRGFEPVDQGVPSEFDVEFQTHDLTISFKSALVDDKDFPANKQISIRAPSIRGKICPLSSGMELVLRNNRIGNRSVFNSRIKAINAENNSMTVLFTEEAKILHSEKTFSVRTSSPIPVKLVDPAIGGKGEPFEGSILEISRLGMKVYSLKDLPVNLCLAVKFSLPDGSEISTPLAIAQKGENDFLYEIEYVVIDERERSSIVQYMYQRQIEQSKEDSL